MRAALITTSSAGTSPGLSADPGGIAFAPLGALAILVTTSVPSTTLPNTVYPIPAGSGERKLSRSLLLTLMKNCDVAEFGSDVRAIATVPGTFKRPALLLDSASLTIAGLVGFCLKSVVKPPP